MEHLYISKNSENIHRGSHTHIEAPHDFSLNFWKAQLGSKNRIELNQFLGFSILFIIWQYLDFFLRIGYNLSFWNFLTIWKSKNKLVDKLSICSWFGCLGSLSPHFSCLHMLVVRDSEFYMHAMMQCKTKSENLAHILGY